MSPGVTSVLLSVSGVLIGGAITWFFAKRYYEKASRDLDRAAEDLRGETKRVRGRLVDLFAALDEAGLIEVEWKESGDDIKGVVIRREFFTQANVSRAEGERRRAESRHDTPGPQEAAQRPWWRRVFGG
jgi:hypothetical protein